MKIEKINDQQVKCTLTSFDLNMLNLNLSELAYGSEGAKRLFSEMLRRAHNECGFDTEDMPVMIEAIPLANESVVLMITKVDEPEEIDMRFARFAPLSVEENNPFLQTLLPSLLEGIDTNALPQSSSSDQSQKQTPVSFRVFVFENLDAVSDAAHSLGDMIPGESSLYKNSDDKRYYLLVDGSEEKKEDFSKACNILSEYGLATPYNYSSKAYFTEHYETIIAAKALDALSRM